MPNLAVRTLEPGQEPDLWKKHGVTGVPALLVNGAGGKSVLLRGYATEERVAKAIDEVKRDDR